MAALTQKSLIVAILAGALVLIVLGYFVYDRPGPCAAISEEVTTSLSGNLDLIRTKGEIFIGKQKVQDLSDESKRYVANLKTCCVVLQGGKLGADQFLQCKKDVEQHETRVTQLVTVINEAQMAQAAGRTEVVKQKTEAADRLVSEVRESGAGFMQKIAQLKPLSTDPPPDKGGPAPVGASEREPNNDAFQANRITLGGTVAGEIAPANDQDWFVLRADTRLRDWMDVKLENRSTSLEPCIAVSDSNRSQMGGTECANNVSANVAMARVVEPGKDYYVFVGSYGGRSAGAYALSVTARKAYDAYEPNDDVFSAKPIAAGKAIDANIMYGGDTDWYVIKSFPAKLLNVRLENRSTSLEPCIAVSDSNRSQMGGTECANNVSANVAMARVVEPGKDYYVFVGSYGGRTAGEYRLTVAQGNQ